ncbi:MAG: hypothetical protein FWH22_09645 [Fibromonadales bacterium]|nr:hypothetical protein [Fibromonadales bacterium]
MFNAIIKVVTFGLILSSWTSLEARERSAFGRLLVSDEEDAALNAGCGNTYVIQNKPWLLGTEYGDASLRAAKIENCICSNGKCSKVNSKQAAEPSQQQARERSAFGRLLVSDEEDAAQRAGCGNTYVIQNKPWLLGTEYGDASLRAAEIENCICSNGECSKLNSY